MKPLMAQIHKKWLIQQPQPHATSYHSLRKQLTQQPANNTNRIPIKPRLANQHHPRNHKPLQIFPIALVNDATSLIIAPKMTILMLEPHPLLIETQSHATPTPNNNVLERQRTYHAITCYLASIFRTSCTQPVHFKRSITTFSTRILYPPMKHRQRPNDYICMKEAKYHPCLSNTNTIVSADSPQHPQKTI